MIRKFTRLFSVIFMIIFSFIWVDLYSQIDYPHERYYNYLGNDLKVLNKKLKIDKNLVLDSKDKDGKDSLRYCYKDNESNNFYTFFFFKKKCIYIGFFDETQNTDSIIWKFQNRYSMLTKENESEYLDFYSSSNLKALAYFEDVNSKIGYLVFRDKEKRNNGHFIFYSKKMYKDL